MSPAELVEHADFRIETTHRTIITHEWDDWRAHSDPYSRLYFVSAGSGRLQANGETVYLKKGHFYLFSAGTTILLAPSPGMDHHWMHFTAHVPGGVDLMRLMRCPTTVSLSSYPQYLRESVDPLWQRIHACSASQDEFMKLELRVHLLVLLEPFLQAAEPLWTDYSWYERFHPVLSYLEAHLAESIDIETLAEIVNLNPNYFSNIFSRRFGMAPYRYLVRRRIDRAQVLLWTTSRSIKEIAASVGYDDVCYFSRIFRRVSGIPPGAYRSQRERLVTDDSRYGTLRS